VAIGLVIIASAGAVRSTRAHDKRTGGLDIQTPLP